MFECVWVCEHNENNKQMEHNQADRSRTWTTIAIIYSSNQKSGHEKRELHLFDFFRNVLILWDLPFWNIAFVSSQHFYASDTPIKNNSFLLWMHYRSLALDWNPNDCKNVGYCGASMSKLPSLYCYYTHNYFWNYTFFLEKSDLSRRKLLFILLSRKIFTQKICTS